MNPRPVSPRADTEDRAIEGARGLAALMVMGAHFLPLALPDVWGARFATTGVDLFFVLSGFVFGPYLLGRPLPVLPHLIRRFFRLYPLYLFALLCYGAIRLPSELAWAEFPRHALMLHTTVSNAVSFFYNPAFWSLPPEVEFYLCLPLLAWLGRRGKFAWVALGAVIMHLAILAVFYRGGEVYAWPEVAIIHLPGLLVEFMAGACACLLARRDGPRKERLAAAIGGFLLLLVLAYLFRSGILSRPEAPVWLTGNVGLLAAIAYALLLPLLTDVARGWGPAFGKFMLQTGHLSYGVYLFHNLLPAALGKTAWALSGWSLVLAATLGTCVMAWLMNRLLEAPLRNYGRRLSKSLAPARS